MNQRIREIHSHSTLALALGIATAGMAPGALGQQQDQARSHHIARGKCSRLCHLLEFFSLLICYH